MLCQPRKQSPESFSKVVFNFFFFFFFYCVCVCVCVCLCVGGGGGGGIGEHYDMYYFFSVKQNVRVIFIDGRRKKEQ